MQLAEVDISAHSKMMIDGLMRNKTNRTQIQEVKKLLVEDKLYANIKNPELWLRDTSNRLNAYAGNIE